MPDLPASRLAQASATLLPTGLIEPRPVTTTRRAFAKVAPIRRCQRLLVRLDVVDRLLHGGDLLGFLVGDLGLELVFERHHELHGVERVGAEVSRRTTFRC